MQWFRKWFGAEEPEHFNNSAVSVDCALTLNPKMTCTQHKYVSPVWKWIVCFLFFCGYIVYVLVKNDYVSTENIFVKPNFNALKIYFVGLLIVGVLWASLLAKFLEETNIWKYMIVAAAPPSFISESGLLEFIAKLFPEVS